MRKLWVVLFVALSLYNCKSRKAVTVKRPTRTTERVVIKTEEPKIEKTAENPVVKTYASAVEQYIDTYKEVAKNEMRLYKIPASITMAQGILESGSGKGRLSIEANNHFGIKCHDWTGARIYHDDDRDQECFRKYVDAKYSYRDHSLFLSERRRYSGLFDLKPDDYKGWAKGLKAAGYATDKKYPTKLIALIERYELYKFDEEVLGTKRKRKEEDLQDIIEPISSNTQVASIHIVEKGDTMYSLMVIKMFFQRGQFFYYSFFVFCGVHRVFFVF